MQTISWVVFVWNRDEYEDFLKGRNGGGACSLKGIKGKKVLKDNKNWIKAEKRTLLIQLFTRHWFTELTEESSNSERKC